MSGPLPRWLAPLTVPLSWAYGVAIAARNARFDRGLGVHAIDRPVISVGNLTVGGTGKTPMVAWIAEQLAADGVRSMIAMRGYKARPRARGVSGVVGVGGVGGVSDEQAEYAQRLPELHVLANPDRIGALREFLPQHPQIDCVLLDDGFQHRQIRRDFDLVLIDATAATFEDRLLPAGRLREPAARLKRADAVIVTHAESEISHLKSQIEKHHGKPPIAWCRHIWTRFDVFHGNDTRFSREIEWLRGKRIATMLGIANPSTVVRQLQSLGADVALDVPVRDHQTYSSKRLRRIASYIESDGADSLDVVERVMDREDADEAAAVLPGSEYEALLVTAKDWVKLQHVIDWSAWRLPIVVPRLAIEFVQGERELRERLIQTARSCQR